MHEARSTKSRYILTGLLVVVIFSMKSATVTATRAPALVCHRPVIPERSPIQVGLSAPYATISWDERDSQRQRFHLPLIYLHRQRGATPESGRTLQIQVTGLAAHTPIHIEAWSHHVDVSTGRRHTVTRRFVSPDRPCTSDAPCTFQCTFDPVTTLSDFYTLYIKDAVGATLWENPQPGRPDFVALDTWDVALDRGGLPAYTARVYYAALFPFAQGDENRAHRLPPREVVDFIEGQFAPIIEEAWRTQVGDWGFGARLHPDWDVDKVVEIIITDPPYTLFGGTGTYTASVDPDGRPYPERRIWWLASNNCLQTYDSLENAYKAVFAHEFFHLMQWNQRLWTGRPANRWTNLFIEAQGKFAPTVQYPEVELLRDHVSREGGEYVNAANRFLTHRLNSSYRDMETDLTDKYDFALYWRFLYEQHGDVDVLRAALEEMARHGDEEIVPSIAKVMDQALARVDGPLGSFEESLVAFARANYALRLENGRCAVTDLADCGGFYYDPDHVYVDPPLEAKLRYDGRTLTEEGFVPTSSGMEFAGLESPEDGGGGAPVGTGLTYNGAVLSSYGMDFVEVRLDPALHGRPLTVKLQALGDVTRFNVQIWQIKAGEVRPRAVTQLPKVVPQNAYGNGAHLYVIPQVDTTVYDRLALIITRLDADEAADPVGNYSITLDSAGDTESVSAIN